MSGYKCCGGEEHTKDCELTALQARIRELEKENNLLAQDRLNWKTLASRDFPTELKEANVKLGKENARLRSLISDAVVDLAQIEACHGTMSDRTRDEARELRRKLADACVAAVPRKKA